MATHAHSTRTPLLPPVGAGPALLGQGSGQQPGPVTVAIRAVRAAELRSEEDRAIDAIRAGLDRHFADADRQRIRDLRRRIADRIEADIALLDALAPDVDLEDGADAEPSLCGLTTLWPHSGGDDREHDVAELSGIGDLDGLCEAHMPPCGLPRYA